MSHATPLYAEVGGWALRHRDDLLMDIAVSATGLPLVGSVVAASLRAHTERAWRRRHRRMERELQRFLTPSAHVVLVDDDALGPVRLGGATSTGLWVRNGVSLGVPEDAGAAITELETQRADGATHIAIAWPARWVLEYHTQFRDHLDNDHHRVLHTDRVVMYELRR
jgi:hypothetical protein